MKCEISFEKERMDLINENLVKRNKRKMTQTMQKVNSMAARMLHIKPTTKANQQIAEGTEEG